MFIHKSHSKNELVKICEAYNFNINNPRQYRKIDLSALIVDYMNQLEYIEPNDDYYFCDKTDLELFLINVNPKKRLTIKEKSKVIDLCKRIKHYCRNGFHDNINGFRTIQDVYEKAEYIKPYGDIPSVRKAIRELNNQHYKLYNIEPIISKHIQQELDNKHKLKSNGCYKLEIKHHKVIVSFS